MTYEGGGGDHCDGYAVQLDLGKRVHTHEMEGMSSSVFFDRRDETGHGNYAGMTIPRTMGE